MDRDMAVTQFTRYVQGFDQWEEGVRLKYDHSLRVSGLCEQIALSLGLSRDDVDLAWLRVCKIFCVNAKASCSKLIYNPY